MKLKISAVENWRGKITFVLALCDRVPSSLPKGTVIPGAEGKTVIISRDLHKKEARIIVSLGKEQDVRLESFRRAGATIVNWLRDNSENRAGVEVDGLRDLPRDDALCALGEGLLLRDYRFDKHKSKSDKQAELTVDILVPRVGKKLGEKFRSLKKVCAAVLTARDLAHEPPNVINPVSLARRAKTLATKSGLKCKVLDHRQLARMKAGAILAVGQGSATPPRLIVLEYPGKRRGGGKPVVIIGKAITFDTGGYSLKPRDSILGMKYDKCGGMAVIGTMLAVAASKPDVPVVGIVAAAENMISRNAYRPDDIIKTMSGKTVQIVSADAEGRLVLCDAITYAQRNYNPRCMIDIATLTGGVTVALGKQAAGLFTNDEKLQHSLMESGDRVFERLWPLPLWDEYLDLIKGDDSDIKNSGGREAHASVGAIFLKQFVEPKTSWAHLDIAAMSDVDRDTHYCPKGATGFGVRLIMDYISRL